MTFYNPWAFSGLITIPLLILLYLLKQKYEERTVSSLYLWQEVLMDMEAAAPWQRLRKNILLILQIIAVVLMTLALARPFFNFSGSPESVIIVIDTSFSMKASDNNPNRMEQAKRMAVAYINSLSPDASVTLINMNRDAIIEENLSKDKNRIRDKINSFTATNFAEDKDFAVSMIQSILRQYPGAKVVQFGDEKLDVPGKDVIFFNASNAGENHAVVLVSHARVNDGITALCRIANYSSEDASIPVSLYVDGKFFDARKVDVKAWGTADVYFSRISSDAEILECRIDEKDSLLEDNTAWNVVDPMKTARVVLVAGQNIFIEKVLSLMKGIEVYRTNKEDAGNLKGYDLYIYDGYLPEALPKDGNIMVFNPPENSFFKVGDSYEYPQISTSRHELFKYASDYSFTIGRTKLLEVPGWGEPVLEADEGTCIFAGTRDKTRMIVFGFDIHNTDLPLKTTFPILMTNAIEWLVPSAISNTLNVSAGQALSFNLAPKTTEVKVVAPDGTSMQIAPPFPAPVFNKTDQAGIYTLVQTLPEGQIEDYFCVNVPAEAESDLGYKNPAGERESQEPGKTGEELMSGETNGGYLLSEQKGSRTERGFNLQWILLWILLAVITIEWWVYANGI